MKKLLSLLIAACAAAVLLCSCNTSDPLKLVDPFVGTAEHGHTFPGAIAPFGQIQVGPDTRLEGWDGCSGYHYTDDTIYGFSHTHLSGTGCSDYGDVLVMPFTGKPSLSNKEYCSPFRHNNEKASPGYYSVILEKSHVKAELSATTRVAYHRYYFPRHEERGLVIDLTHRDLTLAAGIRVAALASNAGETTRQAAASSGGKTACLVGYRRSAAWNPDQQLFFAIEMMSVPDSIVLYQEDKRVEEAEQPVDGDYVAKGENVKAIVYFSHDVNVVDMRVAISSVDEQGALNNLMSDSDRNHPGGLTFKDALKVSRGLWSHELGKIKVEGGSLDDIRSFYTALYHCMTSPYMYSDADGRYRGMDTRTLPEQKCINLVKTDSSASVSVASRDTVLLQGNTVTDVASASSFVDKSPSQIYTTDGKHDRYTVFSLWDTYRALHPLLTLIDRKRSEDFMYTFLWQYQQSGELPMWELASHETHCMIGYHAASVILEAQMAGLLDSMDFRHDYSQLIKALLATCNRDEGQRYFHKYGYLSSEIDNESVSKTLEYSYDDWCIAQMLKAYNDRYSAEISGVCLGVEPDQMRMVNEGSNGWKNLMDKDGFMHPRRNGGFVMPFSPAEVNNHFTEANSWQYSTYVPHDVDGWIALLGGEEKATKFLDSLFHTSQKMEGREQSDITGLIGQYAHGNEPSHHAAYLYAYLGQQWKTAELVRRICKDFYNADPDGLIGNEDCGQMSAWLVMSAMGFYPVCPGSGEYVIGSPLFRKVTIHLENGKDIVINATGQGDNKCYVKSLEVNGCPHASCMISYNDLKNGAVLDFEMSGKPNENFGASQQDRAHSPVWKSNVATTYYLPMPSFSTWEERFDGTKKVTLNLPLGAPKGTRMYYEVALPDKSDALMLQDSATRQLYTGPFAVGDNCKVAAVAFWQPKKDSAVQEGKQQVLMSKPVYQKLTRYNADKTLTYLNPPDPQYRDSGEEGLTDGIYGKVNYRVGGWQGWQTDMKVVVDLHESRPIHDVAVHCLSSTKSWIFLPQQLIVEVSDDCSIWHPYSQTAAGLADAVENNKDRGFDYREGGATRRISVSGNATARYVRITAVNYGALPKWHVSAGQRAWLFCDEVEVM